MLHPDTRALVAKEQVRDRLVAAGQERLVETCCPQPSLIRQFVSLIGHVLVWLGGRLLHYSTAPSPAVHTDYPTSSIKLF